MPVAVVTGASSGIGRATAEEFARQGYQTIVLARRKELLEELIKQLETKHKTGKFEAIGCDISNWSQVEAAAKHVEARFGKVNVLINNAGAYEYKPFEKSDPAKIDELIDVNVRGIMYVTRAFLGLLKNASKANEKAKIINVSSISGLWGFSNMSVYTATKFAVTGFSSALRRELLKDGIDVTSIHPGPVRSKEEPGSNRPKKRMVMLPPQIAKQIFDLVSQEKSRYISHPVFSLLNWAENVSPSFVDKVLRKIL